MSEKNKLKCKGIRLILAISCKAISFAFGVQLAPKHCKREEKKIYE